MKFLALVTPLSIYHIASDPHLLSWREAPSTWMSPVPASRQPPLLVPANRAACLHLPPCPDCTTPTFDALGMLPGSCHPWGVFPGAGPSAPLCPCIFLLLILCLPESSGVWFLLSGGFFVQGRAARETPLPGSIYVNYLICVITA